MADVNGWFPSDFENTLLYNNSGILQTGTQNVLFQGTTVDISSLSFQSIVLSSTTPSDQQVLLTFNQNIALLGDALLNGNWTFTSATGTYVRCLNVEIYQSKKIKLTTTKFTPAVNYTLYIPDGVVSRECNLIFDNVLAPSITFEAVGTSPSIAYTVSEDSTHIIVIFTETVNQTDAETHGNYSTNPSLTISASVKISDMVYKLTTSSQTPGQTYVVTATNIRDLDGNYIV